MKDRTKLLFGVLAVVGGLGLSAPASAQSFVHPGILHTTADLDRMRDKVAAGEEPYVTGWNRLRTDGHARTSITPRPQAAVRRIPEASSWDALMASIIGTVATLFGVGAMKTIFSRKNWVRSGLEMMVIGVSAAAITYMIGTLFSFVV